MIHPGGVCVSLCLIVTPRILTMLADCINCLAYNIIALGLRKVSWIGFLKYYSDSRQRTFDY